MNGNFGGGTGELGNAYLIEDIYDLDAIRKNLTAYYQLNNNIFMTWQQAMSWNPILYNYGYELQFAEWTMYPKIFEGNGYIVYMGEGISLPFPIFQPSFFAEKNLLDFGFFQGGDGSEENPYLVSNVEDLNSMRINTTAYYNLINNISFTQQNLIDWIPITYDFDKVYQDNQYAIMPRNLDLAGFYIETENITNIFRFDYSLYENVDDKGALIYAKKNNIWVRCDAYVKKNGVWQQMIAYVR